MLSSFTVNDVDLSPSRILCNIIGGLSFLDGMVTVEGLLSGRSE